MNKLEEIITKSTFKIVKAVDFQSLKNRKVLITGSTGLIGTYLLATLKMLNEEKKMKIKVYAYHQSPCPKYFKLMFKNQSFKFIKGDLTKHKTISKLPQVDFIIHAATYAQPQKFLQNPISTFELNTTTLISLLKKIKSNGKLLFISSSEVYSGSKDLPYKETDIGTTTPQHKRACYIEGKRSGETICNIYKSNGIDAKAARLSLIYGPGTKQGDQRILNQLIEFGIKEKRITLKDEGKAMRTYCFVTDAIILLWKILLHGKNSVYNVGGISRVSIKNLAIKIGELLDVRVTIPKEKPFLSDAPTDVQLDLSLINKEFGQSSFVSLVDGLKATIEWQKKLEDKIL